MVAGDAELVVGPGHEAHLPPTKDHGPEVDPHEPAAVVKEGDQDDVIERRRIDQGWRFVH